MKRYTEIKRDVSEYSQKSHQLYVNPDRQNLLILKCSFFYFLLTQRSGSVLAEMFLISQNEIFKKLVLY